jgi:hypothetical protein
MPDERWQELFTPESLAPFAPERGMEDDPIPALEVHFLDKDHKGAVALMLLAGDNWNDSAELRREILAQLGTKMADEGWQVFALRLATAAWMRDFTKEEEAARQERKIETYDDKTENMIVAGSTMDQRQHMVYARIWRDKRGRVRGVGKWQHFPPEAKLEFYLLESAWAAYMRRYMELHNPLLLAQFERVQREVN